MAGKRNTELRRAVLQRDNYLCVNCDEIAHHAHHIVPLAIGGRDHIRNMVSLCHLCHRSVHGVKSVTMAALVESRRLKSGTLKHQKCAKKTTNTCGRRRNCAPEFNGKAAFNRLDLARRWGLGAAAPSLELLQADRGGLRERLRLGFFVFNTDEYGPQVAAIHALGVPALLERFQAGETIAATDPAVLTLHANATAHRGQLAAAAGVSPGKLASGTLRNMLRAVGWELVSAGQINTRNEHRGAMAYRAEPIALPEGVDREALEAVFLEESKALLSTVNNCNNPPVTDA